MGICGVGLCNSGFDSWDLLFSSVPRLSSPHTNNRRLLLLHNTTTTTTLRRKSISSTTYSNSCCFGRQRNHWSSIRCSTVSSLSHSHSHSEEDEVIKVVEEEEDDDLGDVQAGGPVIKFNMSDFVICDHVSIGLGGRGDELVFQAMVKNPQSPLYNSRVVLRRFTSSQAQRRGRRAIEVLKKLAHRKLLYHSYSMQVHGFVAPSAGYDDVDNSLTLVHGYHGSYSLRHWLQLSDWLPTLEATLALDEECVKKVGDDTVGGPAISRKLRIIRILMRDLLIGVNYLHSHGLAHTELRLENVHISPLDRHIKVGILGNARDFYDNKPNGDTLDGNMERRRMMIAFDMRCVGFMMAKMVLQELMDPLIFSKFKSFLTKGNDPSCLREFLMPILCSNISSGNSGLQILDRNWGAGWNLLSLLLAINPYERLSCLDALRHPFLCGPRWRVEPSMEIIRWGLGSTAIKIIEEYIYGESQRSRLAHFIELMEMLNPCPRPKNWLKLLPGRWRLLYCTGRHVGLTFRQPSTRVLIGNVHLNVSRLSTMNTTLLCSSDINFRIMIGLNWPHEKTGVSGKLKVNSLFKLTAGRRLYLTGEVPGGKQTLASQDSYAQKSSRKWKKGSPVKEPPSSLPIAKLASGEIDVMMSLDDASLQKVNIAQNILQEVRKQIPSEMFDVSRFVCGTYVDSRLLILRGVNGSALLFTRSCI